MTATDWRLRAWAWADVQVADLTTAIRVAEQHLVAAGVPRSRAPQAAQELVGDLIAAGLFVGAEALDSREVSA